MTEALITYSCLVIGMASLTVGGAFQAFSEIVMRALGDAQPAEGIRIMQHINRIVFRTVFLVLLIGLAPVTAGLGLYAGFQPEMPSRFTIIFGVLIYLVGVMGVTMLGNVPMNERLADLAAETLEAADYWPHYLKVWTRLNHIRTIASIAAGGAFLLAALGLF